MSKPVSKRRKPFATKAAKDNSGARRVRSPAFLKHLLKNMGFTIVAVALFTLAHPNPIFMNGLSALAWVMYLPILILIRRSPPSACLFWGALYGFAAFSLFNYWLSAYEFIAGAVVYTIYLCYFALLFLALRIALALFPRYGFILQWLIFVGFEYLRTLGFLGYPYGITGYTQWQVIPLIQIADITGVWGVSALIIFPQTLLAQHFRRRPGIKCPAFYSNCLRNKELTRPFGHVSSARALSRFSFGKAAGPRICGLTVCLFLYVLALVSSLIYGLAAPRDFRDSKTARIALIQHNTDPWKDDKADYQNNFRILKRLSEEALAQTPKPDMVVWSETAFVPMIYWHSHYRTDNDYYAQVKELLDFLERQDVPFVIGNDDGRREMTDSGSVDRVDYNAAILFEQSEMVDVYRKIHLVPFTEHFPYKKQLPFVYKMLENSDTHFWKKGTRRLVFDANGLRFSTPICFEDTFGYLSREFVQNGAELIVNLSNDAWSHSLSAQMQHLSMAVFRSVENRRSMTRSTASGQTCAVAPDGRILAMAKAFTETALTVSVPVVTGQTFYTKHGDFLPRLFLAATLIMSLLRFAYKILKNRLLGRFFTLQTPKRTKGSQ